MKWAEISITTTHKDTEVVANIFHDLGSSGVVIEDPELVNEYRRSGMWDYCDIPEAADTETVTVKAYLPVDASLEEKLRLFKERVDRAVEHDTARGHGNIACQEVREEDWSTSWKAYFHPLKVGARVVIKPTWEAYIPATGELVVEIDPGMAFGSGTHPSTVMCIRALEELTREGQSVFDVGTGSGVLAVTAAKLGASFVRAVDSDALAARVAAENIRLNQVEDKVTVETGDLLYGIDGTADLIIANIVADAVIRMMPDVPGKLRCGGALIASGIIAERLADVTAAARQCGLTVDKVTELGGWAAMVIRREGECG